MLKKIFVSPSTLLYLLTVVALASCSGDSAKTPVDAALDAPLGIDGATTPDVASSALDSGTIDSNVPVVATLHLVGDSTVAGFNDPYYYPRYGYGTQIGKYMQASLGVNNLALSGRSSKSYIDPNDNSNYAVLKSALKAGDFLMIGFGHNDEKADDSLYTNPNTGLDDPTSFQYYLYTYYIKVARDAGATPILVTPIVRRDASGAYAGAKAHVTADVTAGTKVYPGGDYPAAIRALGAAQNVTVIDATALTMALGKQLFASGGEAATANLQAWVDNTIASVDDTHTNIYGAAYYAYLIANAVAGSSNALAAFVRPGMTAPDASILVPNPNWHAIAYTPPTKSTVWTTTDPWWGSVFGDVGGVSKITDGTSYSIAETSTNPLVVTVRSGGPTIAVGKISAASDGIAYYFQQIPIDKDFTLSATATVTSVTYNNSQVGFGLMVRDAVWTDTSNGGLLSSYVACGILKGNAPATAWSSFARDTSAATQLYGTTVTSATAVPATGATVDISIVRAGAVYTCTFGNEPPKTYTLDLNAIDSAYVYAGMFTARAAEISYSNIKLVLN